MSNTIKIKKYSDVIEEYVAAAAITPGMLVELASATTVQAHSGQDENVLIMVALEDELQGGLISTDYDAEDQVQVWVPGRGDMINGILALGQNAVVGDFLTSNGDGNLKVAPAASIAGGDEYPEMIIGQAIEAVNATAAAARIKVRIK